MGATNEWDRIAGGEGCALCDPERLAPDEYGHPIAGMGSSTLYLKRDQRFRGGCVLVHARRHVRGLEHLEAIEAAAVVLDLQAASRAIAAAVGADHMNTLSLGNLMPHLHWHIIPRRRDDGHWGRPHWEAQGPEVRLGDDECHALVDAIRTKLRL